MTDSPHTPSPEDADPGSPLPAETHHAETHLAGPYREDTPFGPVPVRYRHDGWVPDRQTAFIEALAASGCVDHAAKAVGMSRTAAYALRRRPDAQAFRLAWDAAMDLAVTQLGDAALSRAINGVPVPLFHNGEQIGERRHFDERLTMFVLRYRDPLRYGKWIDRCEPRQPQDAPTSIFNFRLGRAIGAAWRAFSAAVEGKEPPAALPEPLVSAEADSWR